MVTKGQISVQKL